MRGLPLATASRPSSPKERTLHLWKETVSMVHTEVDLALADPTNVLLKIETTWSKTWLQPSYAWKLHRIRCQIAVDLITTWIHYHLQVCTQRSVWSQTSINNSIQHQWDTQEAVRAPIATSTNKIVTPTKIIYTANRLLLRKVVQGPSSALITATA